MGSGVEGIAVRRANTFCCIAKSQTPRDDVVPARCCWTEAGHELACRPPIVHPVARRGRDRRWNTEAVLIDLGQCRLDPLGLSDVADTLEHEGSRSERQALPAGERIRFFMGTEGRENRS